MSSITISLEDELLDYLKQYVSANGTSIEAHIRDHVKQLQKYRSLPLHPHVVPITGLIPADIDVEAEYKAYIEKKYL